MIENVVHERIVVEYLLIALCAVTLVNCAMLVLLFLRRQSAAAPFDGLVSEVEKLHERTDRSVRDEISRNRDESANSSRVTREELAAAVKTSGESFFRQMAQIGTLQKAQLDTFSNQVTAFTLSNEQKLEAMRATVEAKLALMAQDSANDAGKSRSEDRRNFDGFSQLLLSRIGETAGQQKQQLIDFRTALQTMTDSNNTLLTTLRDGVEGKLGRMQVEAAQGSAASREESSKNLKAFSDSLLLQMGQTSASQKLELEKIRETVEGRLASLQADNAAKLEAMRQTVDEKLHATLEQRLGESFKLVSDRLELVHKGLGEMQSLAHGVGDLKKVLSNIKTRGNWGEVQLGNLLEQMLTPDQYASNVQVNPQTMDRVEYAVRLPGRDANGTSIWLPIDAKFPQEDYQRLVDAAEIGDADAVASSSEALASRICGEAKKIKEKYICAPHTTDFAILFLPTEGLFAEVLRRPGICDGILHDHRVVLAGPTTLAAVLSSLQMGFRTLAIEQRSSEVWQVLGAVKTEFGKFGDVLEKLQKKLQEASNTVDRAATRSRVLERKLNGVQQLPAEEAAAILRPIAGTNSAAIQNTENSTESESI